MINIYKQPKSANTYANLFIQEISDNVENVCLLFIGHLETIYNILVAKPSVNFTVIDGSDTTEALPYIYNGANLKESITFEDGWCEANDTFIEGLHSIFDNMSFDLVIANPPYGLHNSIAKKIMHTVLKTAKDSIWLVPKNTYKDKELWKKVKDIRLVENCFADASVQNLSIAKLDCEFCNTESFENLKLSKKQIQVKDAVLNYNISHKTTSFYIPYASGKESKIVRDVLNIESKENLKEAFLSGKLFFMTQWTPFDGVHLSDESEDIQANLKNSIDWNKKGLQMHAFYFEKAVQKTNFSNWWYSCNSNQSDKKSRIGLTNFILSILRDARSANGGGYDEFFPHLDWSHPWTDKEILKEIGLPEDFLEKE